MSEKVPPDFEWVTARAACSPPKIFERLKAQIEHDVELRNKIVQSGYKFSVTSESAEFAVFLDSTTYYKNTPIRVVRFYLEGQSILAKYADDTEIFTATLTLNEEGECRLRIKDKNYDLWQVRHMALERLFFELIKPL